MGNSNGIISAPVRVVEDIAYVLGESSGDLGTLCLSSNINLLSRRKPTQYAGVDSPDPAQPRGSDKSDVSYYDGTKSYGVSKAYLNVSDSQYHPGDKQASLAGDFGAFNARPSFIDTPWSAATLSKYRALDFDGYVHGGDGNYPICGGSRPYLVFNEMITCIGNTVTIQAGVRYDYNDIRYDAHQYAGLLGLRSLFGLDAFTPDTPAYVGVIMYAPVGQEQTSGRLDRTVPLTGLFIKTATQLGTVDSGTYGTGSDVMINALCDIDSSHFSGNVSDQNTKFLWNENVYVFPVIARRNLDDSGWRLFALAYGEVARRTSRLITSGGQPTTNTMNVSSATITYRILRQNDGSLVFYLENDNSFKVNTSGNVQNIYFGESDVNTLQAGPGDGHTTVIKFGADVLGTSYDAVTNERWYTPRGGVGAIQLLTSQLVNGWSGSAAYASRKGTFILKPYENVSTFKVNVSMKYLHVGSGLGEEKILSGYADVSASAQTGDTVTITLT